MQTDTIVASSATRDAIPFHFVRLPELKLIVGLGRTTIFEHIGRGTFPSPIKISGTRALLWRTRDIASWLERQGNEESDAG